MQWLRSLFGVVRKRSVEESAPKPYRAYTTAYDRIVAASAIDEVLEPISAEHQASLDQAWGDFQSKLAPWKSEVAALASQTAERILSRRTREELADTVVCLLLDQSGSLRGEPMLYVAAVVDAAQAFLADLGVKVEILGFTTSRWRGGASRELWIRKGRPPKPGRINDLLHIVYKRADDRLVRTNDPMFRTMLRPDLLKENIDGEAVEWACGRLRRRREPRKLLLVISDGAPVDDATHTYNDALYLPDHLSLVLRRLSDDGDVDIGAVGFGHDVSGHYKPPCVLAEGPDDLGQSVLTVLEQLLTGAQK